MHLYINPIDFTNTGNLAVISQLFSSHFMCAVRPIIIVYYIIWLDLDLATGELLLMNPLTGNVVANDLMNRIHWY